MTPVTNVSIKRFETENFFIDIVEDEATFEAWLQEKHEGVASLMFGTPKEQYIKGKVFRTDLDLFCKVVEEDLDDYIYDYYRKYFDGCDDDDAE
jgi:hypothetical protein